MSERPFRRLAPDHLRPEQVESAIADLPLERAYLFDAAGLQIVRFDGDESRLLIQLSASERERIRGGLLIHNHPPNLDLPPSDPQFDAASFSDLDVRWAAASDLGVMIAVSPTWRHVLIRPRHGWHGTLPTEAEFVDSLKLLYDVVDEEDGKRISSENRGRGYEVVQEAPRCRVMPRSVMRSGNGGRSCVAVTRSRT
jgi:hypothetical protein